MAYFGDNADSSRTGYGKGDAATDKKRDGSDKNDVEEAARRMFSNSYDQAQAARDAAMNALGKAAGAKSTEGTNKTLEGSSTERMSKWDRFVAGLKGALGLTKAAGSALTGNIPDAALTAKYTYDNIKRAVTGYNTKSTGGWDGTMDSVLDSPNSPNTRNALERLGDGKDTRAVTPLAPVTPITPVTPTPAPVKPFDYFSANSRKKQGYQSTILGGGLDSNYFIPQKKRLLGE